MTIHLVHMLQHRYYRHMQHDEALGFAINQQMFAERLTNIDLGHALGISKSTVSRKIRGHVTWSAEEVSLAAHLFGIPVDALMPTPDGSGGWVPAPYMPAGTAQIQRDPAPYGTGSVVVAGTGFEPATSGQWLSVLYLLVSLHMLHLLYGFGGFGLVRRLAPSRALILGGYGQGSHFNEVSTGGVVDCPGSVGAVSAGGWSQ